MAPFQQLCQVGEASECTGLSKFPSVPSPASLQDFLPQFLQPWGWSYSGAPGKGSCEVACLAFSLKELTRNSGDFNIPETIRLCYDTDQKKPAFLKQDQSSQLINSFPVHRAWAWTVQETAGGPGGWIQLLHPWLPAASSCPWHAQAAVAPACQPWAGQLPCQPPPVQALCPQLCPGAHQRQTETKHQCRGCK